MSTERELSPLKPEQDLSSTYHIVRELSAGANDRGYLVSDGKDVYVALVPNRFAGDWNLTLNKVQKAKILDKMELHDYVVHVVAVGTLLIKGQPEKAVLLEYGGEPITKLKQESEKLVIVQQVWYVTQKIHEERYAINDFQPGHWLYLRDAAGRLQVKMIDYQQIREIKADDIREDRNDHRRNDLRAFRAILMELFPWARFEPLGAGRYAELQLQISKDIAKIETEAATLANWQKGVRAKLNGFKQKLSELF